MERSQKHETEKHIYCFECESVFAYKIKIGNGHESLFLIYNSSNQKVFFFKVNSSQIQKMVKQKAIEVTTGSII